MKSIAVHYVATAIARIEVIREFNLIHRFKLILSACLIISTHGSCRDKTMDGDESSEKKLKLVFEESPGYGWLIRIGIPLLKGGRQEVYNSERITESTSFLSTLMKWPLPPVARIPFIHITYGDGVPTLRAKHVCRPVRIRFLLDYFPSCHLVTQPTLIIFCTNCSRTPCTPHGVAS